MIAKLRSLGMSWSAGALNWTDETFFAEETLWTRIGRWIEIRLSRFFQFCYSGSDQEIDDAFEGFLSRRDMSERQRAAGIGLARIGILFDEFFCVDCDGELLVSDAIDICASCRALRPEILLEDRKADQTKGKNHAK